MKRIKLGMFFLIICFFSSPVFGESITIVDNVNRLKVTMEYIVEDGQTMVCLSEMAKTFKAYMQWNPITKVVILTKDKNTFNFSIGSPNVKINNRYYKMECPIRLITGRIFIPLSFIVSSFTNPFNLLIRWDAEGKRLIIDSKDTYVSSMEEELVRRFPPSSNLPARGTTSIANSPIKLTNRIYEEQVKDSVQEKSDSMEIMNGTEQDGGALISTSPPDNTRIMTIVIDPGHGGKDSGAVGKSGLLEKNVVLNIAKKLKFSLQRALPDINILLTRDSDYFIPLRERTRFANYKKADLFISIHSNASYARGAHGFEVFHLSTEATDNAARALAAAENEVISLEHESNSNSTDMVKLILGDIAQQEFIEESIELAGIVQSISCKNLGLVDRGVKSAFFWVLRDAMMPAVLIEVGFLSNPLEENKLRSDGFRDDLVSSICDSIVSYKAKYEGKMGFDTKEQTTPPPTTPRKSGSMAIW
ncbi:MAG: N-acetylmuramoyl-L-alanine amidase [Candidatus Desantisbacteria bacterium]